MTDRVGFAGIGIMGLGMANNLIAKGHALNVWNRTRAKAEAVRGAEVANSLEDLAAAVESSDLCDGSPEVVAFSIGW